MKLSLSGHLLLMRLEGFVPVAYWDDPGYAWGFGEYSANQPRGRVGLQKAIEMLVQDVDEREAMINKKLKQEIKQHQYDAVVSIYYNAGTAPLNLMIDHLNRRYFTRLGKIIPSIAAVSKGRKNRRKPEQLLYQTGEYKDIGRFPTWDGKPSENPMYWTKVTEEMKGWINA